jgi:hypothetical protein
MGWKRRASPEFRAAGAQRSARGACPVGTLRVIHELAAEAHLELLGVQSLGRGRARLYHFRGKRNQSVRLTLVGLVIGVEFTLVAFEQHMRT